jgi:hypothetical protein
MTPVVNASELISSWTLGRDGHTLTCTLIRKPSGRYILRLRHGGRHILDERCDSPQQAVTRSLEAFHVFLARGWLPENAAN